MSTTVNRTWRDNPRLYLAWIIKQLSAGDTAICAETGWQVICINAYDGKSKMYIVYLRGEERVRRRDPAAILNHLLRAQASKNLVIHYGGAVIFEDSFDKQSVQKLADTSLQLLNLQVESIDNLAFEQDVMMDDLLGEWEEDGFR
jgi:hypothetical protein